MAIHVICNHCGRQFRVEERFAGRTGACPACGASLTVPAAAQTPGDLSGLEDLSRTEVWYRPVRREPKLWAWVAGVGGAGVAVFLTVILLTWDRGRQAAPGPLPPTSPARSARSGAPPSATTGPRPIPAQSLPAPRPEVSLEVGPAGGPEQGVPEQEEVRAAQAPAEASFTGTPLPTETVEEIITAYLRADAGAVRVGIRDLTPGQTIEASVGGHTYKGRIYRSSQVYVLPGGRISIKSLHLATLNDWSLRPDLTVPAGAYVMGQDGAYRAVQPEPAGRAARERDAFVADVIVRVNEAVALKRWDEAEKALEEGLAKYPDSAALQARRGQLHKQRYYTTITVENGSDVEFLFRLDQAGRSVIRIVLRPGQSVPFELQRGLYLGRWGQEESLSLENVAVTGSETWSFYPVPALEGSGQPWVWVRRVILPGVRGGPFAAPPIR